MLPINKLTLSDIEVPLTAQNLSIVVNVWGKDDPISLKRSLMSIEGQETKARELIIVVDGPINSVLEGLIEKFVDGANQVIRIPTASGLWNARNVGIVAAGTEFVALHDADDVMHPMRLTLQLKEAVESQADIVVSPVYEFDAASEQIIGLRALCDNSNLIRKMRWHNVINHSSVLLRRSAVLDLGGYRDIYLAEDYDLWIRMIEANKRFSCTPQVLQAFAVDSELMKRRGGRKFIASELAISRSISKTMELNQLVKSMRLIIRVVYRLSPRVVRKIHRTIFQTMKQSVHSSLTDFLISDLS